MDTAKSGGNKHHGINEKTHSLLVISTWKETSWQEIKFLILIEVDNQKAFNVMKMKEDVLYETNGEVRICK